jgi:hypothetical protein
MMLSMLHQGFPQVGCGQVCVLPVPGGPEMNVGCSFTFRRSYPW